MQGFKIMTTVFLAIIIAMMMGVVIVKSKERNSKDTIIVASIFTAVMIMAIAAIWM